MAATAVEVVGWAVVRVATMRTDTVRWITKMREGATFFFASKRDIRDAPWDLAEQAPLSWRQPARACIVQQSVEFQ